MKKFKITFTATREFEVPDNCTDEQYDELKAICRQITLSNLSYWIEQRTCKA